VKKERIDNLINEKGLVDSRTQAQRLIMAGQVRVDGVVVLKPGTNCNKDAIIEIDHGPKYVSRGGEKIVAALVAFDLTDLAEAVCADVGVSTGGFTDCLIQHGAKKVYAIDVGYGVLHWKLRNNPKVVVMERTNARYIKCLPEPVDIVTIDASFISLKYLLPNIKYWLGRSGGKVIALIKPQFEVGQSEAAKGEGVIRDPGLHRIAVKKVIEFSFQEGYHHLGLIRSPLLGPKGNKEFFAYLSYCPT
jgi:23S rRNA (cytidine1920-2'-O)/16S rRNA (cytidine1409-2'-O)-methyltransferase